jgi:hypothetical protein
MKTLKAEIYTVTYIQDGLLFENYTFLSRDIALSFGDTIFARVKDQLQSSDYIALECHEPNSEKSSIRLKQWDIDDLEETVEEEVS